MTPKSIAILPGLALPEDVPAMNVSELATLAQPFGRRTVYGSLGFFCNVRNRSAGVTVYVGSQRVRQRTLSEVQQGILGRVVQTLEKVQAYVRRAPLIKVQRTIGANQRFNVKCTLYLSTQRPDNVRQAYLWANTLSPYRPDAPGPEVTLVCIPEWPEADRQVLVFPEANVTLVLGSDYVGEVKMGFLRQAMWLAKEAGMLSLHAGSKVVRARDDNTGRLRRYGMTFFGLSGTGKTTHSCHTHGLDREGEGIEVLQDDITFLKEDGAALGTEVGFYLKTEGVEPETQPLIYQAVTSPEALLENVLVDHQGNVDLEDDTLTSNGRTVIPRRALGESAGEDINLPPLAQLDGLIIAFVTRRMTVAPIASRLTAEQAAATFMLGESVETSAGDPRRAGQSVRVVGTNPFIVGDEAYEGNRFYRFLKEHQRKVQCYLLNTGGVGEVRERDAEGRSVVKQPVLRVAIPEMAAIIRGIVRDAIQWEEEPLFGTLVPRQVPGVDMNKFSLRNFYTPEQIKAQVQALKEERQQWLARFPDLEEAIRRVSLAAGP